MNTQPGKQDFAERSRTALSAAWGRVSGSGGAGERVVGLVRHLPQPMWAVALVHACRRDPKKAGIFAVLVVAFGIMWLRMSSDGGAAGPASASASKNARAGSDPGAVRTTRRAAGLDAAVSDWRTLPVLPPRNLFAVKFDYFPRDGSRAVEPARGGEGFWAELGKSLASRTDEKKQRQVLIENLQLQAAKLRLETTMMGARPKAVINGEMVGEGDLVASGSGVTRTVFRVSKIEARRIIVEREGIKLEIPMK